MNYNILLIIINLNQLVIRKWAIPIPKPLDIPVKKDLRKHGISENFFPNNFSVIAYKEIYEYIINIIMNDRIIYIVQLIYIYMYIYIYIYIQFKIIVDYFLNINVFLE